MSNIEKILFEREKFGCEFLENPANDLIGLNFTKERKSRELFALARAMRRLGNYELAKNYALNAIDEAILELDEISPKKNFYKKIIEQTKKFFYDESGFESKSQRVFSEFIKDKISRVIREEIINPSEEKKELRNKIFIYTLSAYISLC